MISDYLETVLVFAGINIIAAYSFYIPFKTGQISLGQAGFMAVGAYASAIMTAKFGMPFFVGLLFGAAVAGLVGVSVGFPALRIKGIYLLLLTLAFAEIVQVVILTWEYAGGAQGFQNIPREDDMLAYVSVIVAILIVVFGRLERSSLGRAMDSIHEDDLAAEVMGIDIVPIKLLAFGFGGFIAGLAGGLFAHYTTYVDQSTFNILIGIEILMFVLVGGAFSYWGPVVGALFLTFLPEFLRSLRDWIEYIPTSWTEAPPWRQIYDQVYIFLDFENEKRLIVLGLILIIMMIVRPQGLASRETLQRYQFIRRRLSRA